MCSDCLTADQVCEQTGVSYRMLDWWVRTGIIRPTVEANGSGSIRQFSQDEVRQVVTIAHLRELGFELEDIRDGLRIGWDNWIDQKIAGLMAAFPRSGMVDIREAASL